MYQILKYKCKKCGMEYGEEPECCWHNACYCTTFDKINRVGARIV